MKSRGIILIVGTMLLVGCNRQPVPQVVQQPTAKDSLVKQVQQKDSSIMAYIRTVNSIQHSIDTLMIDAKVLKKHGNEPIRDTSTLLSEIRTIGSIILKDKKALAEMQRKLKITNEQNNELVDLGESLSKQLNERDSEINAMQTELFRTKTSLSNLAKQFNDSINVINQQRAQISVMQIAGNTVYYIAGTEDDLVQKGLIVKEGGAVGLGRVPVLSQAMNENGLVKGDLTKLTSIPLSGRLQKLVTVHPFKAYRITTDGTTDKIIITDPQDFWSKSKYLVAIVSN